MRPFFMKPGTYYETTASAGAVVLDGASCTWSKRVVGAPSVIRRGNTLHVFYDGQEDGGISHYHRHVGMATMELPIVP